MECIFSGIMTRNLIVDDENFNIVFSELNNGIKIYQLK